MSKKILLVCMLTLFSFLANGQNDSLLTITIVSNKSLPQMGLGANGKHYFVMSTNQDRRTLIELRKELYKDSMLVYFEELNVNHMKEIKLLKGRLKDRGDAIDAKNATIIELEQNYANAKQQKNNAEKNVDDLKGYIKRKRLGWWSSMAVGITGGILYIYSRIN